MWAREGSRCYKKEFVQSFCVFTKFSLSFLNRHFRQNTHTHHFCRIFDKFVNTISSNLLFWRFLIKDTPSANIKIISKNFQKQFGPYHSTTYRKYKGKQKIQSHRNTILSLQIYLKKRQILRECKSSNTHLFEQLYYYVNHLCCNSIIIIQEFAFVVYIIIYPR